MRLARWTRRLWSNLSVRTKGLVVVAIPLGSLLISFVSHFLVDREREKARLWVEHTSRVRSEIDKMAQASLNAETGVRGYLLTRREEFLEPYRAATRALPGSVSKLFELVKDNPPQTGRLRHVQSLTNDNFALLATLMEKAGDTASRPPSGREESLLIEGKRKMDALRQETDALDAEEQRLQAERTARVERIERWRAMADAAGVALGLLGAVLAVQLFSSGIVRRVLGLQQNADRLAEGLPLVPSPEDEDEIGALARHLEKAAGLLLERSRALNESLLRSRQSEILYRALAHHFPNGAVFLFDHDLRFLVADGSGLAEVGPSREALEGRTLWEAFPSEIAAELEPLYRATLGGAAQVREMSLFDRLYLLQTLPIKGEDGQIYAGMAVTQDITERKQAEQTLETARREAEEANSAKSEFLSRMSHELRTPLNAILGFAQLLEIDDLPERQSDGVGHILRAGRHLLNLINEVLDITRIESGKMPFSTEPVAVCDLLVESFDLVRPLAAVRHIQLTPVELGEFSESFVQGDQQRLRQVLLNLLSNAIKYNRDGGQVGVHCERSASEACLRIVVRDTGPGITPEKQRRLFIAFDRLGAEQDGRTEGTGLGLALSRNLVEAMGGSLGVESIVGEGSTFWVELPRAEGPVERHQRLEEGHAPHDPGEHDGTATAPARTVLYIEDNLSNLALVEHLLRLRPGIRLLSAMQGLLGLELAREHRPDLILLDLHLPDLSGHEVLLRLRTGEGQRAVPVVIMSADATAGQIARLTAAGANAYLTKPFKVEEFLRIIDNLPPGHSEP